MLKAKLLGINMPTENTDEIEKQEEKTVQTSLFDIAINEQDKDLNINNPIIDIIDNKQHI